MMEGNIRIIFTTIWVETTKSLYPSLGPKYSTDKEAFALAQKQYDYYIDLCKTNNDISFISDYKSLQHILSAPEYHLGIVPIIEGSDFIHNSQDLNYWLNSGIRIFAPIWQKNQFGGCSELGGGLTDEGKKFVNELAKANCVIDIAHMSISAADTLLNIADTIIVNTHTACKHFVNSNRLITDYQIKKIHEHKGVIGLMTWSNKLSNKSTASLNDLINHIKYIANLTGTIENIAIGSSMDGGYGREALPKGMSNIGSLNKIGDSMLANGFTYYDVESVLYKNWKRVLEHILS